MSSEEERRIWQQLNALAVHIAGIDANVKGQSVMISEVLSDVKKISIQGCSKSDMHKDQEARIRALESSRNYVAGATALAGTIFGTIGGWLLTKLTGG